MIADQMEEWLVSRGLRRLQRHVPLSAGRARRLRRQGRARAAAPRPVPHASTKARRCARISACRARRTASSKVARRNAVEHRSHVNRRCTRQGWPGRRQPVVCRPIACGYHGRAMRVRPVRWSAGRIPAACGPAMPGSVGGLEPLPLLMPAALSATASGRASATHCCRPADIVSSASQGAHDRLTLVSPRLEQRPPVHRRHAVSSASSREAGGGHEASCCLSRSPFGSGARWCPDRRERRQIDPTRHRQGRRGVRPGRRSDACRNLPPHRSVCLATTRETCASSPLPTRAMGPARGWRACGPHRRSDTSLPWPHPRRGPPQRRA